MTTPQVALQEPNRWEALCERNFNKMIQGGISWLRSKLNDWSEQGSFDAQINRYGHRYVITITTEFRPPPLPEGIFNPQEAPA